MWQWEGDLKLEGVTSKGRLFNHLSLQTCKTRTNRGSWIHIASWGRGTWLFNSRYLIVLKTDRSWTKKGSTCYSQNDPKVPTWCPEVRRWLSRSPNLPTVLSVVLSQGLLTRSIFNVLENNLIQEDKSYISYKKRTKIAAFAQDLWIWTWAYINRGSYSWG